MNIAPSISQTSLPGARVTVMGLGRFGGGVGVTRWLVDQGALVTITDLSSEQDLRDSLSMLSDLPPDRTPRLHLGGHDESDFANADLIVVNPAVPRPWENPILAGATERGIPLTTEIRLLTEQLDRTRVVGVTGSAGKSTTSAMIHHILTSCGIKSHLGGNIGGSLLNALHTIQPDDVIVLELSSAMLYWLGDQIGYHDARGWSPGVAVLTNIEPNHLDWHGTFEHYSHCKGNLFRYQNAGDHQIRGEDFQQRRPLPLAIPGKHNQLNGLLAVSAALRVAGVSPPQSAAALASFQGLPHRLELIASRGEQRFYNDSKATVPEATLLAVAAFPKPSKVHLIAGGYDKGLDLAPISRLADKLAGLYTIGATGHQIVSHAAPGSARHCDCLSVAIDQAMEAMAPDHILLLSPGCASWDQFDNYEQRGDAFSRQVSERLSSE